MRKIFKKGSALILTTVILVAFALIGAGLTMYFFKEAKMSEFQFQLNKEKIQMTNEFYKNYQTIIEDTTLVLDDESQINLVNEILNINVGESFHYVLDEYDTNITCQETFKYNFSIKTKYRNSEIEYIRYISYVDFTFNLSKKEVFKTFDVH